MNESVSAKAGFAVMSYFPEVPAKLIGHKPRYLVEKVLLRLVRHVHYVLTGVLGGELLAIAMNSDFVMVGMVVGSMPADSNRSWR